MIVFQCLLEPQKIDFLVNMGPTWPDFASQDGPKLAPKWDQNRSKIGLGSEVGSRTDFGTISDRFRDHVWSILGTVLGRFWVELWLILGRCWIVFGSILGRCWSKLVTMRLLGIRWVLAGHSLVFVILACLFRPRNEHNQSKFSQNLILEGSGGHYSENS